jgi:hypothetical protein
MFLSVTALKCETRNSYTVRNFDLTTSAVVSYKYKVITKTLNNSRILDQFY